MLRGLSHFWRINLAVALAAAVNTAVLAGALIVGDSVRGSLRDMTLDRLGDIELALVADRFYPESLAARLASTAGFDDEYSAAAPAILLPGTAVRVDTGARASRVNVHGIDAQFAALFATADVAAGDFEAGTFALSRGRGMFAPVLINATLQRQIGAAVGDAVLLNFRTRDDVPDDTLLGNKQNDEGFGTMRATVVGVIADVGIGRFSLSPHQAFPANAYVALGELQSALDREAAVNAVFVATEQHTPRPVGTGITATPPRAQTLLHDILDLSDLGLRVEPHDGSLLIESTEFVLRPQTVEAIEAAAAAGGASVLRVTSYLATSMSTGDRSVPYSTVAALGGAPAASALPLAPSGEPAAAPTGNEIYVNEWTAADLVAGVGDALRMEYYVVGPYEQLEVERRDLRIAGIVAMAGLGADARLTPDYPGIGNTANIADWDPPFPLDLRRVRDQDERYWDEYGATPKAFVSEDLARELWSTRYGSVTSMRLRPAAAAPQSLADLENRLSGDLLSRLNLQQFGMRFLEVKSEGLEAASGATDFSGLFVGFSFFLIASAAMLVGLLFRLGVETRAVEVGLRLSVGYTVKQVRRQMLLEGCTLAAAGALAGLGAAIGYAALMMVGLRTLWLPAVGTPMLTLHVNATSLAAGWALSLAVVTASIWWTVRRLGAVPASALLKGAFGRSAAPGGVRRWRRSLALAAALSALAMLAYAVVSGTTMDPIVFGTIGFPLLVAGLATFAEWCRTARGRLGSTRSTALLGMAARNSSWNPGRSIMSVALVAFASFVIVTVAANYRDPTRETQSLSSGTGGFALYATSEIPLHADVNSPEARFDLGFGDEDEALLGNVRIMALRTLPGDDASCLNLYRPQKPRLLGVSDAMIDRGGFTFATRLPPSAAGAQPGSYSADNDWTLLLQDFGPGIVPVLGDANSVQWILHLGLGDDLVIEDELGRPLRLRIVGTFAESVFRSELLLSEANLLRYFPSQSGYSTFLADIATGAGEADAREAADAASVDAVAAALERALGPYGFDAERTDRKLADFLVVQNTYLSTFQLLGGLGLLLGTVGLSVVLVRNLIERRPELATLRAFGYRRADLRNMVLAENAFLLLVGTSIGSAASLIAVAPRFVGGTFALPWGSLSLILLAVLATGMASSVAAVATALRVPLLPVLKGDR